MRFIALAILFLSLHSGSQAGPETAAKGIVRTSAPNQALYARILAEVVRDGRVDYARLGTMRLALEQYTRQLAIPNQRSLDARPPQEAIAFWINAYNAITLKYVADKYPVKSIRKIRGVWDRMRLPVGPKQMTLDEIEHEVLREGFNEPRIHFALVCASVSCPVLRPQVYTGDELDAQLNEAASDFLNDPERNRIDPDLDTVYLSKIFDWYGKDFVAEYSDNPVLNKRHGKKIGSVLNFAKRYLPPRKAAFIEEGEYEVRFMKYDWGLNDIRTGEES